MVDEQQLDRVYTVNLSDAYLHQRTKRAKWAISLLRSFVAQHLKVATSNVKLSTNVSSTLYAKGIQNPPRSIKIRAIRSGDVVRVYLKDEKIEEQKTEEKEKPKAKKEEQQEKQQEKNEEKPKTETELKETEKVKLENKPQGR